MSEGTQGTEVAGGDGLRFSDSVESIAPALLKVQEEIEDPPRSGENPHFGSSYVKLEDLIHVARPVLSKHGISLHQAPGMENGAVTVETVFLHESGEWARCKASSPMQRDDPQGVGSAVTYLRRYSLASMLGLAHEPDDDGERAVGRREGSREGQPRGGDWEDDPATDNQLGAIRGLLKERDLTDDQQGRIKGKLEDGLTEGEASKAIDWLKRQPEANGGAPKSGSEAEGASAGDVPGESAAKEALNGWGIEAYDDEATWSGKLGTMLVQHPHINVGGNPEDLTEAHWSALWTLVQRYGRDAVENTREAVEKAREEDEAVTA